MKCRRLTDSLASAASSRLGMAVALLLGAALLFACASREAGYVLPRWHPAGEELGHGRPICTDCHEPAWQLFRFERFNHTVTFVDDHRLLAGQRPEVCAMCHQQRFCTDCHGVRVERKPAEKYPDESYRRLVHRGDYLIRHRIDGRIDPTSCFRCHGNPKTAQTCRKCHG